MNEELRLKREPRAKPERLDTGLIWDHPFFWAEYLLVDTVSRPRPATSREAVADPKAAAEKVR